MIVLATAPLLLTAVACATAPPLQRETERRRGLVLSYLRDVNSTNPSDPVLDDQDPAIKSRLRPPELIHYVNPQYTEELRRRRQEGEVLIGAVIERDGSVTLARVLSTSGFDALDRFALERVKEWRYQPATLDGKPVRVLLSATIDFSLR